MKIQTLATWALFITMISTGAWAKVPLSQASKLGNELTLMGAETTANSSGSIPKYTGGLKQDENADPLTDVFSNERPLFTITSKISNNIKSI